MGNIKVCKKCKEGVFRFQIKSRKTGKLMVEEIVTFGSDEYPFPDDYENHGMALKALWEYEEEFIRKYLDVSYERCKEDDCNQDYEVE